MLSHAFAPSPETMAVFQQHPELNYHMQVMEMSATKDGSDQPDAALLPPRWMTGRPKKGIRRWVKRIENDIIIGYIDENETPTEPCRLCQNIHLIEFLHLSGMLNRMKLVSVVVLENGLRVFVTLETTEEALMSRTPLGHARFQMTFQISHLGHQVLGVIPAFKLPNGFDLPLNPLDDGMASEILIDLTGTMEQATENVLAISNDLQKKAAVFAQTLTTLGDSPISRQELFDLVKFSNRNMSDEKHDSISKMDAVANNISTSLVIQNINRPPKTLLEALSLLAAYLDYYQPASKGYFQRPGLHREKSYYRVLPARLMERFLADILALRAADDAYCMGSLDPCSTLLTWVRRFHYQTDHAAGTEH